MKSTKRPTLSGSKENTAVRILLPISSGILFILVLSVYGTLAAQTEQDELSVFAIAGMQDALAKIESVQADYCVVNADNDVESLDIEFLRGATYSDIVANMGLPRSADSKLGDHSVCRTTYRRQESKEFMSVHFESPRIKDGPDIRTLSTDRQSANLEETGLGAVMDPAKFDYCKAVYHTPEILFSHYYLAAKGEGIKTTYAEMVNRSGSTAVEDKAHGTVAVSATYDHASDRSAPIVDGDVNSCTMELNSNSFLPKSIEYSISSRDILLSIKVDTYIEQNGVSYPTRGSIELIKEGKVQNIVYYIVDESTIEINKPLPDNLLRVIHRPGTPIFDEVLDAPYATE